MKSRDYYIVVDNMTSRWLPVCSKRNATSAELTNTLPPRLFVSRIAAQLALNWWKEGIWYNKYRSYFEGEYDIDLEVTKIPSRSEVDLRVVKVRLTDLT
jgi:hypothetical protein